MRNEHGCCSRLTVILLPFLLMSGCSSTTIVEYSRSELELVPEISFRNTLLPGGADVVVEVSARGMDTRGVVEAFAGEDHVLVVDENGQEIALPFSEITDIKHVRVRESPETTRTAGAGETAGYALIYGPMVPLAVATLPFLRALGLDEGKNSADERKAALVYLGMSREDLRANVGEPKERYSCDSGSYEVWVFEDDKVLRGGRALFIHVGPDSGNLRHDTVWHNSQNTTFFKDSCALIS